MITLTSGVVNGARVIDPGAEPEETAAAELLEETGYAGRIEAAGTMLEEGYSNRRKFVFVAHDCGLIINPDGLRNQIEGNVIQAMSRTLKEEVKFDRAVVTSLDWTLYPILRFPEIPEVIIELINRPDQPAVGAGEATTSPIAPAIANAIFNATGVRLRMIPFTPERVKAALA